MVFLAGVVSIVATSPPIYCNVADSGPCDPLCEDCPPDRRLGYFNADPVYLSYDALRTSVRVVPGEQPIKKAGKIFVDDTYLYVNDRNRGVHIYDHSDPNSPKALGFIEIPGNVDLAVKGATLFVDSFIDLVVIDLQHFPEITISKRVTDIFPYNAYQMIDDRSIHLRNVDPKKGVIIGFSKDN